MVSVTHKHTLSLGFSPKLFEPKKHIRTCCENNTILSFCKNEEMQQVAATIFEVAGPEGLMQELGAILHCANIYIRTMFQYPYNHRSDICYD